MTATNTVLFYNQCRQLTTSSVDHIEATEARPDRATLESIVAEWEKKVAESFWYHCAGDPPTLGALVILIEQELRLLNALEYAGGSGLVLKGLMRPDFIDDHAKGGAA